MTTMQARSPGAIVRTMEGRDPVFTRAFWRTIWHIARLAPIIGVLLVMSGLSGRSVALGATGWAPTGPMAFSRAHFASALLPDGRVLVAGGQTVVGLVSGVTASAEVYSPATGAWSLVQPMSAPRSDFTATTLPNGLVLVSGGSDGTNVLASTELFDPRTNTWSSGGSMLVARSNQTATLLADGRVLVAGGSGPGGPVAESELYNPATNSWRTTESMRTARDSHAASRLRDGRVLVTGGIGTGGPLQSAELYDPISERWTTDPSTASPMLHARYSHTSTLLPSGRVLIAGGFDSSGSLSSTELYDPPANFWLPGVSMATPRGLHTATALPDGEVLVAGGENLSSGVPQAVNAAEIYNPYLDTWLSAGTMNGARYAHTATLLSDGRVLVAGGISSLTPLSSAVIYTPQLLPTPTAQPAGPTATPIPLATSLPVGPPAPPPPPPVFTPPTVPVVVFPTVTPTPTATAIPPPTPSFKLRGLRVEKYGSKPDWQLTRPSLGKVVAGTRIRLSVYAKFTALTPASHVVVAVNVYRAGKLVYRAGVTENRSYTGDLWDHWAYTPSQPGKYLVDGRITVNDRSQHLLTTFTAARAGRVTFSFDRLDTVNGSGQPSHSFTRTDRVLIVAVVRVQNAYGSVPASITQHLEYSTGSKWRALGLPVQSSFDTTNGRHAYTISFVPQSPYRMLRMVVDVTIASRTQSRAVAFEVRP
jgi:hypothetical protein